MAAIHKAARELGRGGGGGGGGGGGSLFPKRERKLKLNVSLHGKRVKTPNINGDNKQNEMLHIFEPQPGSQFHAAIQSKGKRRKPSRLERNARRLTGAAIPSRPRKPLRIGVSASSSPSNKTKKTKKKIMKRKVLRKIKKKRGARKGTAGSTKTTTTDATTAQTAEVHKDGSGALDAAAANATTNDASVSAAGGDGRSSTGTTTTAGTQPNKEGKGGTDGEREEEGVDTHTEYNLTYGMMVGIRVSVGWTESRIAKERAKQRKSLAVNELDGTGVNYYLSPEDFQEDKKWVFPPAGSRDTPPHQMRHKFKFKDYAPRVFRNIRKLLRVDATAYIMSLAGSASFIEFVTNSKSGQFFYYSHDARYIIKTQTKGESKFLREILPLYYKHLVTNPHSMLPRFFGMHRVKLAFLDKEMHFVVMGSVLKGNNAIHRIFDLKGSMINRYSKPGSVGKDINCLEYIKDNPVHVGEERRIQLLDQLRCDAKFLADLNIMDYSLLLGIHNESEAQDPGIRRQSVALHEDLIIEAIWEDEGKAKEGGGGGGGRGKIGEGGEEEVELGDSNPVWSHSKGEKEDAGNKDSESAKKVMSPPVRRGKRRALSVVRYEGSEVKKSETYYMGIIDILQEYNIWKKAETVIKSVKNPKRRNDISSVPPSQYGERFVKFCERVLQA